MDPIRVLIDFVFDNIFVVFALFAFLSFLLNKGKGTSAGKKEEPQQRRHSMPPFGGEGPFPRVPGSPPVAPNRNPSRMAERKEMEYSPPPPSYPSTTSGGSLNDWVPEMDVNQSSNYSQRAKEDERPVLAGAQGAAPGRQGQVVPGTRRPASAVSASTQGEGRMNLHARNAAQGMIWSEVYGPPRALRPHGLSRKYSKR